MRLVVLAWVLVMVLASGCLEDVRRSSSGSRERDTYRFIEVLVDFRVEGNTTPGICGFPAPPDVDEQARTIAFHNDWPGRDLEALFLTLTTLHSGCGSVAASWATTQHWDGIIEGHDGLPENGRPIFEMRGSDGALLVDGEALPAGGARVLAYEGTFTDGRAWTSQMTVKDLGRWPLAGLSLAG